MARQEEANDVFALTSFLYGGNADYIEELYAAYETDPNSVNAEWRDFFANLGDNRQDVLENARGASWEKSNWPVTPKDELTNALDGNWAEVEKHISDKLKGKGGKAAAAAPALTEAEITQAARDSVRAIMMIRAYRMPERS
uniref:2-oxoglutarate dehydrogenase E1 component N-terminal domain-containing protein n=1 Tax=Panagrolaimus superbus TaxID=310955 RepID=A0A914XUR3_9BILA